MIGAEEDSAVRLYDTVSGVCAGKSFYLLEISVSDWYSQLSPWPASEPGQFSGKGDSFLKLITEDILSRTIADNPDIDRSRIIIIGYSLAGLFSLWTLYKCDIFAAAASCSGSLWYSGFTEYMSTHEILGRPSVYLSLGSKEEKAKNRFFATIGEKTREAAVLLKNDARVVSSEMVLNPGGHGIDVEKRLALAADWCLENTKRD
ncbi:MAG: alpha/beta hydrolase [Clostridiales bacterium]|nr:alpha/beta hydrolase [Clostridiales bacterium]